MQNNRNNIRTDRFGNPYQLLTAIQQVSKDGEAVNSQVCFAELGGKIYKIEVSERQKELAEKHAGKTASWVKITLVKKRKPSVTSM
jgi:hypothetical protein